MLANFKMRPSGPTARRQFPARLSLKQQLRHKRPEPTRSRPLPLVVLCLRADHYCF